MHFYFIITKRHNNTDLSFFCNFPRPTTQTMLAPHFIPQFGKVAFTLRHLGDGGTACALLQVTGTRAWDKYFT